MMVKAEPCDVSIVRKTHRAAFNSSAPSHLQMAGGDVEVKAAFEKLRQPLRFLSFIPGSPLLPRLFVDMLHIGCRVTFGEPSQV